MAAQILYPTSSCPFTTFDQSYPYASQTSNMDRRTSTLGSLKNKFFSRKSAQQDQARNMLASNNPCRNTASQCPSDQQRHDEPPPPAYDPMPVELEGSAPASQDTTSPEPLQGQKQKQLSWLSRRTARNASAFPSSSSGNAQHEDEQFEFLRSFDTILLIDDSTSMTTENRWNEVSRVLAQLMPICTHYDTDGVDIRFLNTMRKPVHSNVTSSATVLEIFDDARPCGATPIGTRLASILRPYMQKVEAASASASASSNAGRSAGSPMPKPINIIVITDGEPTDDPESIIVQTARKLDAIEAAPWQIGIQFFQVGSNRSAKQYLEHLDDELAAQGNGCRDIVDTVPYNGKVLDAETILKVVLGAVNKRLDRKRNTSPAR